MGKRRWYPPKKAAKKRRKSILAHLEPEERVAVFRMLKDAEDLDRAFRLALASD